MRQRLQPHIAAVRSRASLSGETPRRTTGFRCAAIGIKRPGLGALFRQSASWRSVGGFCQNQTFAVGDPNERLWSVPSVPTIPAVWPVSSVDALESEHYPSPPCSTSTAPRSCLIGLNPRSLSPGKATPPWAIGMPRCCSGSRKSLCWFLSARYFLCLCR